MLASGEATVIRFSGHPLTLVGDGGRPLDLGAEQLGEKIGLAGHHGRGNSSGAIVCVPASGWGFFSRRQSEMAISEAPGPL